MKDNRALFWGKPTKGVLLLLITVLLLALISCGSDTSAPETKGSEPATSAAEGITTEGSGTEGITEEESPEQNTPPSEEVTKRDTPNEGTTAPSGELDLPKVTF